MGLTYTKSEIRTRVLEIMRDTTGYTVLPEDTYNRAISDVHRDFVERSGCNRNWAVFSIAAEGNNGVLEYDEMSSTPTLTKVDVEGFNWYRLSGCDHLNEIERFVVTGDTSFTPLEQVDAWGVSSRNLLSSSSQYPHYYQMQGQDLFRVLRKLDSTAGYPISLRITYRQAVIDLITTDADASAAGDESLVPSVPLKYRKALVWGAAAALFDIDEDNRADKYRALYERAVVECEGSVGVDSTDKPPELRIDYKAGGG